MIPFRYADLPTGETIMKNTFRLVGLIIVAGLLGGCMFHAQTVHLDPQVQYVDSNDGHGLPIAVVVKDERTSQDLGHRGNGVASAATISSDADVAAVLKQYIVQGLSHRGFNVVGQGSGAHAILTVRLRSIKTQLHQGFWTGHEEVNASAQVTGANNDRTYDNFYRVNSKESKFWVPTAGQNSDYINGALSNLIGKIINDEKLISFLAS
jgi:uncharacterized lipoprotein YajG